MSNPVPAGRGAGGIAKTLSEAWWLFLLRGVAAIIFGVLAFFWPGITLLTLVLFYGAFMLVDGLFALGAAIVGKASTSRRWWLAVAGVLGIGIGVMTFMWPGVTLLVLLLFIAGWAFAMGVMQIIGAIQLRKEIDNEWLLILSGALSVVFGIAIVVAPVAGAVALIWMMAFYTILFGAILIGFSFRLKKYKDRAA
jgi:uncharacterized membrane protein HdeD (DUF308 family)